MPCTYKNSGCTDGRIVCRDRQLKTFKLHQSQLLTPASKKQRLGQSLKILKRLKFGTLSDLIFSMKSYSLCSRNPITTMIGWLGEVKKISLKSFELWLLPRNHSQWLFRLRLLKLGKRCEFFVPEDTKRIQRPTKLFCRTIYSPGPRNI